MTRSERSFVIEKGVPARCSADQMMTYLLDATTWPEWQPEIVSTTGPKCVAVGDVVSGRAEMLGFHVDGRSLALEVDEGVFEEDVVVGVGMKVRYEVHPTADGCRVVHRLESQLPGGIAGRLLSLFLRGRLRRMQRTAVEKLVAQSEAADPS